MEYQYATICESVADTVPDKTALVHGSRRITWADYERRSARLSQAFLDAGLGKASKVGLFMYNGVEYAESGFAAYKMRGVPINVNYRYLADEVVYILENCEAEAVVYHRSLADRVAEARDKAKRVKLWVEVDDDPGGGLDGVVEYEELLAAHDQAPRIKRGDEDVVIIYTGGTTGYPKGVVYGGHAMFDMLLTRLPAMVGLDPVPTPADCAARALQTWEDGTAFAALSACPLMHGTGYLVGLLTPHIMGGTSVFLESRGLNPPEVWSVVEKEDVRIMVIVGDPFAKPLLRELESSNPYDLDAFKFMISSGAMFSAETKVGLVEQIPHLTITDALGSTEGFMAMDITVQGKDSITARLMPLPTTKVLTEDGREVEPGSDEVGMLAVGGNVPSGYYNDETKTAAVFKEVNGTLYSFPGDMAKLNADGSITLLGRGNQCINTGGEKVFPEEVEEAMKSHATVEDALVFGVDDEKYGNRVVSVAAAAPGATIVQDDIIAHVKAQLASYKAPYEVLVVEATPRTPSGKPDYPAAKRLFGEAR